MKIWYVSTKIGSYGSDLSCAWENKKDAINYFKKIVASCDWKIIKLLTSEDSLSNNDYYIEYLCKFSNKYFIVGITPLFFNEPPYQ